MSTAAELHGRPDFPTRRGRRAQPAIGLAARTVIARKGILATTIADIYYHIYYRAIYCQGGTLD